MNRPSYWILLFTLVAGAVYAFLPRSEIPAPPATPAAEPVVVHGTPAPGEERTARLEGQVLDRMGWPIAGAGVELIDRRRGGGSATTSDSGDFHMPVAALRRHRVRLTAPEHQTVVRWMHPGERAIVVLPDRLPWVEEKPPGPVPGGLLAGEGFLKGDGGEVVPNGVVSVVETGVRVAADASGRYRVALPDGPATLLAHDAAGRVARSEPVYSVRKQGLVPLPDLVLRPGLALRGYLKDPEQRPADGAALTLRGQGVRRAATTDASGAFAFVGLLPGTYVLEGLPHRGALGFRRQVELAAGAVDLDVTLLAAKPLEVRVVTSDGAAVAGVWVLAEESGLRRALARTGDDGRATFGGMGPGPFAFEVHEPETFEAREIVSFDEQRGELTVR